MENEIKIFENEEFGKVRTVIIDGEPWFVLADICKILEISNSRMVVFRKPPARPGVQKSLKQSVLKK